MNWQAFFYWFHSEKISFFVATCCFFLASKASWYHLPPQAMAEFGITLTWIEMLGKLIAIMLGMISLVYALRSPLKHGSRLPYFIGLAIALVFPYWLAHWSPSVTFLAKAYHNQKLAILRHVDFNFSHVQALWKQNITLDYSTPIQSIFLPKIENIQFFQIPIWEVVVKDYFGFSNSFFEFIGGGWSWTIIGSIIGCMSFYISKNNLQFKLFLKDVPKILLTLTLVITLSLIFLISTNILNSQLTTFLAKGEYEKIISRSSMLKSVCPTLTEDTNFLIRFAQAEYYQNKIGTTIDFATGVNNFNKRDYLTAINDFKNYLAASQPKSYLAKGYLASSLINLGVEYFNNKKPGSASQYFQETLVVFPGHIEALYDLMLSTSANGNMEASARVAEQMIEYQNYYQIPSIGTLGQAYLHKAWGSYDNSDLSEAWKQYRQSIDHSSWE